MSKTTRYLVTAFCRQPEGGEYSWQVLAKAAENRLPNEAWRPQLFAIDPQVESMDARRLSRAEFAAMWLELRLLQASEDLLAYTLSRQAVGDD